MIVASCGHQVKDLADLVDCEFLEHDYQGEPYTLYTQLCHGCWALENGEFLYE